MSDSLSTPAGLDPETGFTTAHPSISQAAQDLRNAVGGRAEELLHTAESKAHELKDRARDQARHLREAASGQWQDTRTRAKEFQVTAEDYIRENPTQCVLGALGVGFLIGLMVRR